MDLTEILIEAKKKWGKSVVEAIKKKISEINLIDSGELEKSITFDPSEGVDGGQIFSMKEYAKFQDLGVNPVGKNLYETEFQFKGNFVGTANAIKKWGKLGDKNPYAVARKIQFITGLKPKKFYRSIIEAQLEGLGQIYADAYSQYLNDQIEKYNKKK